MFRAELSGRQMALLQWVGYLALAAVAVAAAASASSPPIRWGTLALCAAFGAAMARSPGPESPPWRIHLHLGVQVTLGAALMLLHENWSLFTVLYFIVSAQAMLLLPVQMAVVWIAGLFAVTLGFSLGRWEWPGGLMGGLLYGAGYALFAVFAYALASANAARHESQALLRELQQAHAKLQEYAGRVEELAAVEERNRLAREMHDTLGHRLTVAAVQLEAAQRLCPADPERSSALIGTVREQVREALAELRATVAALRAPIEADLDLRTSLRRLAAHFEQATGLAVYQVLPDSLPPLSAEVRLALFRAAQEALTNVQRHAEASQVWLVLSAADAAITLLVSDDGRGVAHTGNGAGFGLQGLRERAERLGGELYLEPRRGGGTQLTFWLPLQTEADQ